MTLFSDQNDVVVLNAQCYVHTSAVNCIVYIE